jgi:hypothetical protein
MKEVDRAKLAVNGQSIGMKQFIQDFVGQSVYGMVNALRIKGMDIEQITLEIKYKEKK